jgi:hypothetical protein
MNDYRTVNSLWIDNDGFCIEGECVVNGENIPVDYLTRPYSLSEDQSIPRGWNIIQPCQTYDCGECFAKVVVQS